MKRWSKALVLLSSLLTVTLIGAGLKTVIRAEDDAEPSEDIEINTSNFPDDTFRSYIIRNFDKNNDNILSKSEIESATEIIMDFRSGARQMSYEGIEYFTSLTKFTSTHTRLTSLDLSKNTKLEELNCFCCWLENLDLSQNENLQKLNCSGNLLKELDISNNTALTTLNCYSNQLTSLDVNKLTALTTLNCDSNQLTSLDVNKLTALTTLNCGDNQLTSLDVSKNTMLTELYCTRNQLTSLDVSNNTKLKALSCYSCQLMSLDTSKHTELEWLSCGKNQLTNLSVDSSTALTYLECDSNQLTSLDVSKNVMLTDFRCQDNMLTTLDVSNNTELTKLYCYANQLTNLDVSKNVMLTDFRCQDNMLTTLDVRTVSPLLKVTIYGEKHIYGNFRYYWAPPGDEFDQRVDFMLDWSVHIIVSDDTLEPRPEIEIDETNFPDDNFREYISWKFDMDKNNKLSEGESDWVLEISVKDSRPQYKISSLKGIEYFTSLTTLNCRNNYLTSLDVSKNTQLLSLDCSFNKLDSLDVGQNTKLKLIDCQSNKLVNLNVSGSTSLTNLNCNKNELTALDVSNCKKLTSLDCNYNRMSVLDVSKNTKLENLYCNSNLLTELDVSKNTLLTKLRCNENQLTNLDVRQNTLLKDLQCKVNQLTELDVSQNALEYLLCSYNNLRQLDLTKCQLGIEYCKEQGYAGFSRDGKLFYAYEFYEYGGEIRHFEVDSFVKTKPKYFDPKPTPTPTNTPTPTPSPTNTPTPTQGPTPTPKEPTQGPTVTPTPTKAPVKDPTFEDFVERLYTVALGRASEPEGKAFWIKQVVEEGKTGADCARFFLLDADEFMKRGLSVEDFVETLYATFFDRESDAAGKKGWVDAIKSGKKTRAEVVNDFIESTEWCNVCATYGVKSGAKWHKATFASKNAKDFATRLYTCCLGRDPEEGGLKYWSLALTNLEQTGCSAAKLFFTSDEFVGFKLKDEEYIKRLYTTFMGREPAASEVSYWMGEIKKGTQTKYSVMQFFGQSPEFTEICKKYGIDRGEI